MEVMHSGLSVGSPPACRSEAPSVVRLQDAFPYAANPRHPSLYLCMSALNTTRLYPSALSLLETIVLLSALKALWCTVLHKTNACAEHKAATHVG